MKTLRNSIGALLFVLSIFSAVVFSGCAPTYVPVSNTIPYEVQQNIKTADSLDVAFEFISHHQVNVIETKFGGAPVSYQVGGPMQGMFQELVETKFRNVSDGAEDKIAIEVMDIQTTTSGLVHKLGMTVKVTIIMDGTENSREFNYSSVMSAINQSTEYIIKYSLPQNVIRGLMVKFVVATDKFIDSNFGIR